MAMRRRVRELEAWSIPGQLLPVEYGKLTLQRELWAAGVPRELFVGDSAIPDATDCENLRLAIQEGELIEEEFQSFCSLHDLCADLSNEEAAAKFLEYSQGRCLAWIHLPAGADPSLLQMVIGLLKEKGHVVIDPETMELISCESNGPG
jgi:hypothetical protein